MKNIKSKTLSITPSRILSIDDAIDKFAFQENGVDLIYNKYVKNYDDLLKTNIAFLENRLPKAYYYCDSFGGEGDESHISSRDSLINLHYKKIFTHDGQSNFEETIEDFITYTGEHLKNYTTGQRGYLSFLAPEEIAQNILPHLLLDKRIYISMIFPDGIRNIDNMPRPIIELTCEYDDENGETCGTNFKRRTWQELEKFDSSTLYPNIHKIINKLVFCEIICVDFNADIASEDILLSYL